MVTHRSTLENSEVHSAKYDAQPTSGIQHKTVDNILHDPTGNLLNISRIYGSNVSSVKKWAPYLEEATKLVSGETEVQKNKNITQLCGIRHARQIVEGKLTLNDLSIKLSAFIQAAKNNSPQASITLVSLLPSNTHRDIIIACNDVYKKMAIKCGVKFCDTHSAFISKGGDLRDGHPTTSSIGLLVFNLQLTQNARKRLNRRQGSGYKPSLYNPPRFRTINMNSEHNKEPVKHEESLTPFSDQYFTSHRKGLNVQHQVNDAPINHITTDNMNRELRYQPITGQVSQAVMPLNNTQKKQIVAENNQDQYQPGHLQTNGIQYMNHDVYPHQLLTSNQHQHLNHNWCNNNTATPTGQYWNAMQPCHYG